MLGVGFTAVRSTTGMPLVMPPLMPPLWFVAVTMRPPRIRSGSLAALPRICAMANPSPNSTPLTAGMLNSRWESTLSTLSKKGSPTPAGRPATTVSSTPPTLSPSPAAARMAACISWALASSSAGKGAVFKPSSWAARAAASANWNAPASAAPPQQARRVPRRTPTWASMPSQMAPAATSGAVSRPLKWPPPWGSAKPW